MKYANIIWKDNAPYSLDFGDNYYSLDDPLNEKSYVFLEQNNIPKIWQNKKEFVIGENGFGLGLNFILTCKKFLEDKKKCEKLIFFSYDLRPLEHNDLKRFYKQFRELEYFSNKFLLQYKNLKDGVNIFDFEDKKITLILVIDEALNALKQLTCKVDAWFLDGFAPSKNSEIYRDEVLNLIAKNSKKGTTFTSYSVSGILKRGMQKYGFRLEKIKGFGEKKEMLRGIFCVT